MKKIISLLSLLLVASLTAKAATMGFTVTASGVTNITGALQAQQFVLTSAANNQGNVKIYDAPSSILTNVIPAYITSGVYATNYITSYTNYFGVQNNFTNVALVHYSITNAATTNIYPFILAIDAATNQTVNMDGVTYNFSRGFYLTNAGSGAVSFSITYLQ